MVHSTASETTKICIHYQCINNPTALLRTIASKVKHYLYKNNINYFYQPADDNKRKRIYTKLAGYDILFQKNTINVFCYEPSQP